MPRIAITTATMAAILPQRFRPGGISWRSMSSAACPPVSAPWPASGFLSGIRFSRFLAGALLRPAGRETAVNDAEHHRHKHQGGDGGEYQSADDGAAQGRILFAASAQAP